MEDRTYARISSADFMAAFTNRLTEAIEENLSVVDKHNQDVSWWRFWEKGSLGELDTFLHSLQEKMQIESRESLEQVTGQTVIYLEKENKFISGQFDQGKPEGEMLVCEIEKTTIDLPEKVPRYNQTFYLHKYYQTCLNDDFTPRKDKKQGKYTFEEKINPGEMERGTPQYKLGGNYEGEINEEGKPSGFGRCDFTDGSYYEGWWKNGLPEGYGKEVRKIDDKEMEYRGNFHEGYREGSGIDTAATGDYYGQWNRGRPRGYGQSTFTRTHGHHIGAYKNGARNGYGIYRWESGKLYEGEYINSYPNGKGICTFSDGRRYEGEFKDSEHHGYGTIIHPTGEVVSGEFEKGKFPKKGCYQWADGSLYNKGKKGPLLNGLPCGKNQSRDWPGFGSFKGEIIHQSIQCNRTGKIKYITKCHKGMFTFEDGTVWKESQDDDGLPLGWLNNNGLPNGYGKHTYADGRVYDGYYKAGRFEGKGTLEWTRGLKTKAGKLRVKYEGDFKNGKFDGEGTLYVTRADGSVDEYFGIWVNGDLTTGKTPNDAPELENYQCIISSYRLLKDPVRLEDNHYYERSDLLEAVHSKPINPFTREVLTYHQVKAMPTDLEAKQVMDKWRKENTLSMEQLLSQKGWPKEFIEKKLREEWYFLGIP